eukprot:3471423-Rhodomonas_salina.1
MPRKSTRQQQQRQGGRIGQEESAGRAGECDSGGAAAGRGGREKAMRAARNNEGRGKAGETPVVPHTERV